MEFLGKDVFEFMLNFVDLHSLLNFEQTCKEYYHYFASIWWPRFLAKKIEKIKWHYIHIPNYVPKFTLLHHEPDEYGFEMKISNLKDEQNLIFSFEDGFYIQYLLAQVPQYYSAHHLLQKMSYHHFLHRYNKFSDIWWTQLDPDLKEIPNFQNALYYWREIENDLPWIRQYFLADTDNKFSMWPDEWEPKNKSYYRKLLNLGTNYEITPVCNFYQIGCGQGGAHHWILVEIAIRSDCIHFSVSSMFSWSGLDSLARSTLIEEEKIDFKNWKKKLYVYLEEVRCEYWSFTDAHFYRNLYPKKIASDQFNGESVFSQRTIMLPAEKYSLKQTEELNTSILLFSKKISQLLSYDLKIEHQIIDFLDLLFRETNVKTPSAIPRVALERAIRRILGIFKKHISKNSIQFQDQVRSFFKQKASHHSNSSLYLAIEKQLLFPSFLPKWLVLILFKRFPKLFSKTITNLDMKLNQWREEFLSSPILPLSCIKELINTLDDEFMKIKI